MVRTIAAALAGVCLLAAQTAPPTGGDEQWKALAFLEGTWSARTTGGVSGAKVSGTYTFRKELSGHVLARHTQAAGCSGPVDFNCEHGDLLYVYRDGPARAPKAIYFDNEGHVIRYGVSTQAPSTAEFLSEPGSGPQFRLWYVRKGSVMEGRFQIRMPGKAEWTSYLEWSGSLQ